MIEHRAGDPTDILLVEDNPGDVRLTEEAFKVALVLNEIEDRTTALWSE